MAKNIIKKGNIGKVAAGLAVPAAMVISGLLVWNGSTAAFSGTTSNDGNTWAAGSIALNNDTATALFAANGITPGYTETHCITVNSTADVPTTLKMYTANVSGTGTPTTLDASLDVTVDEGIGSTSADCAGFTAGDATPEFTGTLEAFGAKSDYSTGVGSTALAAGGSKQFRVTVALPASAPNSLQGTTAAASFVWEAQG